MKNLIFALSALMLASPLAGCGFTPLYADTVNSGQIQIEKIEGRSGHALRKELIQYLAVGLPGLEGPATLTIALDENLNRLTFKPDEAASRTDVVAVADYVLVIDDGAITGKVRVETTFNVPDEPFADIAAQSDASSRAMQLMARRLVDDMRIKLANQK